MYDDLKNKIRSKKPDIDEMTLMYFTNYFYVVASRNVIPAGVTIDELIDNVLRMGTIYFFKDDDPIVDELGTDFKGKRDSKNGKLYVRDSLNDELKEMVIYHEIHHAAQTSEEMAKEQYSPVGINQESNLGRLIMEAQTEWFAEEVYKTVHSVTFDERQIPSEQVRMKSGQTITSSLHNYEMYDALLSKLAIVMQVPKEYFVMLNYMYKNNEGIKKLEEDFERLRKEKQYQLSFKGIMQILDYIYSVDNVCYLKNMNKELVLSGGTTRERYEIHTDFAIPLSQEYQASYAMGFDSYFIQDLLVNGNLDQSIQFAKYIFDDTLRSKALELIESQSNQTLN